MTVQRVGSATLNGADLYYKTELVNKNRSMHGAYLLIPFLYDILCIRQILEAGPPGVKPIARAHGRDCIELVKITDVEVRNKISLL